MIREYRDFCDSPTIAAASALFDAMVGSDLDYSTHSELYDLWRHGCRQAHPSLVLHTSGSTSGKPNPYPFGPHPSFWFKCWERTTKHPHSAGMVLLRNRSLAGHRNYEDSVSLHHAGHREWLYSSFLTVPHFDNAIVEKLCGRLRELIGLQPIVTLMGDPHIWLYLSNSPQFSAFAISHRDRLILTSTNSEAFYKTKFMRSQGVRINDTMINWYNGLNFYTCEHGQRHSYPLFAIRGQEVINLLNLSGHTGAMDDLLTVRGRCVCGKAIVSLVPHVDVQPRVDNQLLFNLGLAEDLQSNYESLQFVQNDAVDVCYVGEMGGEDADLLARFVGGEVRFHRDAVLQVNSKIPTFYRNLPQIPLTLLDFRKPVSYI